MLRILRKKIKGQSPLEYVALLVIIIGSFVAAGNYIKRGLQGRWKATADDLGEQYDPRVATTSIRHLMISNTDTQVVIVNSTEGFFTMRKDISNSTERKTGSRRIGAY